jgi:hypothetical protein
MNRILFLLFFVFSFLLTFAQSGKEVEITYLHKVPFPRLFKAGERERFVQQCTSVIDSAVQGTIHFEKAQIGNIKNCKMTRRITSDTIRSYKVETTSHLATKHLLKLALETYGSVSQASTTNGQLIIQWKEQGKDGHFIISLLVIDGRSKDGILTSTIQ